MKSEFKGNKYIDENSLRAGMVISIVHNMKYLTQGEKILLLKENPHKKILKRLAVLALTGKIFRGLSLEDIGTEKADVLRDADYRLARFVQVHEQFSEGEISAQELADELKDLLAVLQHREYSFYDDLLNGGTCYLDWYCLKKTYLKGTEINSVRWMKPVDAAPSHLFGGKKYIIQPNIIGIQMKLILREGKKPRLLTGDNRNHRDRMKKTLTLASEFLSNCEGNFKHLEFDCILALRNRGARPPMNWKAKDCNLIVYDVALKGLTLKKRLRICKEFCSFMEENGNRVVQMMTSKMLSGPEVITEGRRYSSVSNPEACRAGIVIKKWDSLYVFKRSSDWMTYLPAKDKYCGEYFGRGRLVSIDQNNTRAYLKDNNGEEVEILISKDSVGTLARLFGYTLEYRYMREYNVYRTTLYDKGREVN